MPVLRLATAEDAAAIQAIYAPYVTHSIATFEIVPPTVEDIAQRIEQTIQLGLPWLVCENGEQVMGYCYAGRYHHRLGYQWSVEVSVYLDDSHRGQGLGRLLYNRLFHMLQEQGYINVCARISLPNLASVKLHESMGLKPVGVFTNIGYKFGDWHSVGHWQGQLQPHPAAPDPPRGLSMDALGDR